MITLGESKHIYAHIDCDCFFVSVELIEKPWLKGKPVCVCGPTGNSGVVTSASYEARPYGIGAGTPVFKAKRMCPQAIFIKGSFQKYGTISFKLFEILHKISPQIEHRSIDEGYVELSNLDKVYGLQYEELAKRIQNTVFNKLKIPISIGIGPTKTLAKLASDRDKPKGISIVNQENLSDVLATSQIKDVCGFGRKLRHKIPMLLGCHNLLEFIQTDPTRIKRHLGTPGLVIWHELQGTALKGLSNEDKAPKSILRSAMFPHKTNHKTFIHDWVFARLEEALKKLNHYQLTCQQIGVFLRQEHPRKVSAHDTLIEASADPHVIGPVVNKLFEEIYNPNNRYRAAGIWLHNLKPQQANQLSLFRPDTAPANLASVLNNCDQKFGKNTVMLTTKLKSRSHKPDFGLAFVG